MLVKIFNLIKESILDNDFLSRNINYYGLLELPDDAPMPYFLFQGFKSNNVYNISGNLFCLEINFNIIFGFDFYDEVLLDQIIENIRISISNKNYVENGCDIKIWIDDFKSYRESDIWKLNYGFSGIVFLKSNY